MENTYGIGVANRYSIFLDEAEDPLEVIKIQEQEKEAKKKTKLSEKENKGKAETKAKPLQEVRKGIKDTQNVKPTDAVKPKDESVRGKSSSRQPPERGERKFAGETREERNNKRNREDQPVGQNEFNREGREPFRDAPRYDFGDVRGRGARGSPRGIGRGRGRGTGRGGYDARGKREFDRKSGSDKAGVKPVDKREGSGSHNWGTMKDDIADLSTTTYQNDESDWGAELMPTDPQWLEPMEKEPAPEAPLAVAAAAVPPPAVEADGDAVPPPDGDQEPAQPQEEEEPKELTLDEYKAMRGNRQKPTFNLRKAGEGEDLSQWKKMYELNKKKAEEEADDEDEYDVSEYPQRVGRQKHLLEIDIRFTDSRRGVRGRGARGGGLRGGPRGGRGGFRGGMAGNRGEGEVPPGDSQPPRERFNRPGGERFDRPERERFERPDRERFERPDRERFERPDRERFERPEQSNRVQRQSAPKVDDERDFPVLG
ncbi:SERPINE1 mRNA-binding protein 1-like [Bacillus rossius redtenbacheri]|uniref:SERPINE1 mRNA-binding protein 1-like n=1 Tax=Bacillus rossius redtenbacheri TaxID=93214 RepID=UPI002FDCC5C1